MTIAIMIMMLVNATAIAYLATVIFEIRDKMNNVYPELIKIIKEQRDILLGTLDSMHRWSDLSADIIDHLERVEDMEGDIKDIFEWIHSIDDNVANMRMDIQETETKLGDLMAVYDQNIVKLDNNIHGIRKDIRFIQDSVTIGLLTSAKKIEKDITEIGTSIDTNACWIRSVIDNGDTDGDIPTKIISGRGNYRQFLSSSDKDVDALYKEVVDHAIKTIDTTLEGNDEDDDNRDE